MDEVSQKTIERVHDVMTARGIDIDELVTCVENAVPRQRLMLIFSGGEEIIVPILGVLSEALGVSADWLLGMGTRS